MVAVAVAATFTDHVVTRQRVETARLQRGTGRRRVAAGSRRIYQYVRSLSTIVARQTSYRHRSGCHRNANGSGAWQVRSGTEPLVPERHRCLRIGPVWRVAEDTNVFCGIRALGQIVLGVCNAGSGWSPSQHQ